MLLEIIFMGDIGFLMYVLRFVAQHKLCKFTINRLCISKQTLLNAEHIQKHIKYVNIQVILNWRREADSSYHIV